MEYTLEERYKLIKDEVLKSTSKNPIEVVKSVMHKDFISIHGPEHHLLDGAAFLVAYANAGGEINVAEAIEKLSARSIKMPGAMCGYWGICGSVASIGAALSIIHNVGPLSDSGYYDDDMEYTSNVIAIMSKIGGPRCCKRNAFLSLSEGVGFVKEKYGVEMEIEPIDCEFSELNKQCIKERCPFHK